MTRERSRAGGAPSADLEQVLVISATTAPVRPWADAVSAQVRVVRSVPEALELLPVDVVVLDTGVEPDEEALEKLCARLHHASLLVMADDYDDRITRLMQRLGGALCLLPASAPSAVQAQVVTMAGERARLDRDLRRRIEELERHGRELEQSRTRFRDVIERNADAILVVDGEGVIRFANPMASALFQIERDALVGSHFGYPVTHGEISELDIIGAGAHRLVEMRVVESEWEGIEAYIASLRDITERKRAEENALRLSREQIARTVAEAAAARFHFLADASARLSLRLDYTKTLRTLTRLCVPELADWAAFYAADERGRLHVVTLEHRDRARADAVHAFREHASAAESHDLVHEVLSTARPLLVQDVSDARLAGLACCDDCPRLLHQLGAAAFMLVPLIAREHRLGVLVLAASSPERAFSDQDLAVATEIAGRAALAMDNARLYREAKDANQAKTNLLAVISHDLRTPLNAIIGYADLLAMGLSGTLNETGVRQVERMRMSARHLVYLIDELLSFARLDGGSQKPQLSEVDACEIAREVAAVMEPLASERGLSLVVDVPSDPTPLQSDPDRLRQVLLNLAGNAVRYTQQGGVCVQVCAEGDVVLFRVRDTGIGIKPEHLDHIFEPFWQADPGQRAAGGGTGLGLSVVRRIVRMLGGQVSVESELDRGTVFTVRLPQQPAQAVLRSSDELAVDHA